jgi:serine protease Do
VNISIAGAGQPIKIDSAGSDPLYATYMVEYVGAGSIIQPNGIIVTNKHVINNAHEITVTLQDGSEFKAQLLGEGVHNDLALLKIDAGRPLPPVTVGNSDELRVGDRVLAIGNPLGLGGSVSSGIVSGLHRRINSGIAMQNILGEFIQTDAAINHGNSGGPLFNMKGEIIGVDNQIFSGTAGGANIGLGFAIPSNDVKTMLELVKDGNGKPRVGWVGMRVQTVTPRMAGTLGFQAQGGAIVADVGAKSPAGEAGLQVGDIVQSVGDQHVIDSRTLDRAFVSEIGKTLQLGIWRDGGALTIPVSVVAFPQDLWMHNEQATATAFGKISDTGMVVVDLTPELRSRFHLDAGTGGPIVTEVVDNTVASGAGLQPGDLILKVQKDDVHSRSEMAQRLKTLSDQG